MNNKLLTTVICPNILLTESANNRLILEEIQLYENFLNSIKTYLQAKADNTIDDIGNNIQNFKDAGIVIKDIITNPDYLEKVSIQIGKRLRSLLKAMKSDINKLSTSINNPTIKNIINKLNMLISTFNTGLQKSIQLGGWKGMLFKLGLYGFVRFLVNRINEYTEIAELTKFVAGNVMVEFITKFEAFEALVSNFASLTMQKFMDFFMKLKEVKEIFIDTLAEIKRKLSFGGNLDTNTSPIRENGGRVVKGVNTTQDVGPNEIKKQAKKFGNTVNKDGYPPIIDKKAAKNTTPNKAYNLGLTEEYDLIDSLLLESDRVINEDWRKKLRNVAAAGSLGLVGLGGYNVADEYEAYKAKMQQQQQSSQTKPVVKPVVKPATTALSAPAKISSTELDSPKVKQKDTVVRPKARPDSPLKSLRPEARPTIAISGRKAEDYLINMAIKNGINGVELAAFLAQAAQETNEYKFLRELGKPDYFNMYDIQYVPEKAKELGNINPGDGAKYKGRGFIHLTGRYNYEKAGESLGIDLVKQPELLEKPKVGALTAIWFWKTKVKPRVSDFTNVEDVTKIVNPGNMHLSKRKKYFEKYVDTMTRSGKINENDVVDFSKRKEEKQLSDFHKKMRSDIKSGVEKKLEAYDIANEKGWFDDLPVGSRFNTKNGASYKVLSHSMIRKKTDQLPRYQLEFRNKHKFGPPQFVELDGFYYQPVIYAEQVAGEMSGSQSSLELDKLINFETGEKRYTKFTGPQKMTEKKTPDQVKGREKTPKTSKPSKTGEQPHPYRGRLVGETIKEEWFHGTPDVRDIKKIGGFENRNINVNYITNPDKWEEIQIKMADARDSNRDEYFKLVDMATELRKNISIPSPIFLTDNYGVANTYADPKRAYDYQGAEEKVLKVSVNEGNTLTINANGSDFRGISIDSAMRGLTNSGIDLDKAKNAIKMFSPNVKDNKLSTDSLAVIGHMFNFDIIDVKNVLDSYNVGKTKSTVRMVFDPSRIKIVDKLNEEIGYKIMKYDPKEKLVYSLADNKIKFPLEKNKLFHMDGKGIYLGNSEEFVKTYYSGLSDSDEILLKIDYDPTDIISGNNKDSESEFTVSKGTIVDFEIISETVSNSFINHIKENMSYTGTLKKREERSKGIEPGTEEWFAHWFSLPYMIDKRKKKSRKK